MTPPEPESAPRPRPLVGVVILNWNQARYTLRCVDHVLAQHGVAGAVSVLVVDNGSRADELALLEACLPSSCQLLKSPTNLGFAEGMNVGIGAAVGQGCQYVWALNNDAFAEPTCLAELVSAMERDQRLAAVTPRLLNSDGSPQVFTTHVDLDTCALKALPASGGVPTTGTWYVTGAAIFLRAAAFEGEVPFDSRFFAYWEDTDLCVRLLARHWHIDVVDSAVCVHLGSASAGWSSPFVAYLMTRNVALFMRRHHQSRGWLPPWLRFTAIQLVHAAALQQAGSTEPARAILAGLWDGLRGHFGRPVRLAASERYAAFALRHYWGLARAIWGAAHWLSPQAWRDRRPELTLATALQGHTDL